MSIFVSNRKRKKRGVKEGPPGEPWMILPTEQLDPMLEEFRQGLTNRHHREDRPIVPVEKRISELPVYTRRQFQLVFKAGLKLPFPQEDDELFFRFVDTPTVISRNPDLLTPISYQIRSKLMPRFAYQGKTGYYGVGFSTYVSNYQTNRYNSPPGLTADQFGRVHSRVHKRSYAFSETAPEVAPGDFEQHLETIRQHLATVLNPC